MQQNNNRGATRRGIFHTCQAAMLKLNKAEQGVCLYVYLCVCVRMFFKCSYVRSICNDSRGLRHRGSQRGEDAFNAPFKIITIIIIKIQPFSFKFSILLVAINYLMSMSALCQTELTCTR